MEEKRKNIILAGERYVYKFVCDPEALFNMAYGTNSSSSDIGPNAATAVSPMITSINCRNSASTIGNNGTHSPATHSTNSGGPGSGSTSDRPHLTHYYTNNNHYQQLH